jgi:hypothetical protein
MFERITIEVFSSSHGSRRQSQPDDAADDQSDADKPSHITRLIKEPHAHDCRAHRSDTGPHEENDSADCDDFIALSRDLGMC